jgi:four helix bundle protein
MDRPELEKRSQAFATDVLSLCRVVRRLAEGRQPADQLQRCATSAAANYRATSRSRSRAEFVAKMGTVAEESDESVYWLEILGKSALGEPAIVDKLLSEAEELRAIFAASYRTSRRGRRRRKPDQ